MSAEEKYVEKLVMDIVQNVSDGYKALSIEFCRIMAKEATEIAKVLQNENFDGKFIRIPKADSYRMSEFSYIMMLSKAWHNTPDKFKDEIKEEIKAELLRNGWFMHQNFKFRKEVDVRCIQGNKIYFSMDEDKYFHLGCAFQTGSKKGEKVVGWNPLNPPKSDTAYFGETAINNPDDLTIDEIQKTVGRELYIGDVPDSIDEERAKKIMQERFDTKDFTRKAAKRIYKEVLNITKRIKPVIKVG